MLKGERPQQTAQHKTENDRQTWQSQQNTVKNTHSITSTKPTNVKGRNSKTQNDRHTWQTQTHSYTHHTKSFKLTCHFIQRCHNEGDGLFLWQFFLHLPNLLLPGITWNHKECWNNNNSSIQGSLSVHLVTLASDAKWMMYQQSPVEGGEM